MGKAIGKAVMTVKNQSHDAILTAMDILVIPRVDRVVRSISETSIWGRSNNFQNLGERDFLRRYENTPLLLASSRLGLNVEIKIEMMRLVRLKPRSTTTSQDWDLKMIG